MANLSELIAVHTAALVAYDAVSDENFSDKDDVTGRALDAARDVLLNHRPTTLEEVSIKAEFMARTKTFTEWDNFDQVKLIEALTPVADNTSAIKTLIETHRSAVMADEANFDDDGNPIDAEAAEATLEAEQNAFRDLVQASCSNADDVQLKLDYFLNGSVGVRTPLLDCLIDESYCGGDEDEPNLVLPLLRSLVVGGGTS